MPSTTGELLEAGRAAVGRHAWQEGFELLSEADAGDGQHALTAGDLERLAESAWWTGRLDDCISARERAFAAYLEQRNYGPAARVAMDLAKDYFAKKASPLAFGWLKRAERLLEREGDCVEAGYLSRLRGVIAFEGKSDFDESLEEAQATLEVAERFGDRDLYAVALHDRGRALVAKGDVQEGLPLLDESTVAALSGELSPMATGIIYCNMITICEQLGDYRRAGEWTDAAKRWCDRQAIAGFPGMCRVHRAEVMRLRGSWPEAEQEARRACDELREFNLEAAAEAFYEVGEVRLRVGDLDAAEEAFRQAHELGRTPEPGMALLRFGEGKLDSALACIRRALADDPNELRRARLLPTDVELSIAAEDLDRATAATEELESIAAKYASDALTAAAAYSRGILLAAQGDHSEATVMLRRALALWREVSVPYEAARTRRKLAEAYRVEGDDDSALLELRAARGTFERLGAAPDERQATELLQEWSGTGRSPTAAVHAVSAVKTFMFTDIVRSTQLVEAVGDDAWGDLLRWHDRTLRSLFARHSGQEVDHAGDGFFVAFDHPDQAVACAVEIQRTLRQHRRSSGFAPQVRIGVHAAKVARGGRGYRGKGVHETARIASLAAGGEILVSSATLAETPSRFQTSAAQTVELKGVSRPVEVTAVDWS
jgi:class 3 adenylate cyclase